MFKAEERGRGRDRWCVSGGRGGLFGSAGSVHKNTHTTAWGAKGVVTNAFVHFKSNQIVSIADHAEALVTHPCHATSCHVMPCAVPCCVSQQQVAARVEDQLAAARASIAALDMERQQRERDADQLQDAFRQMLTIRCVFRGEGGRGGGGGALGEWGWARGAGFRGGQWLFALQFCVCALVIVTTQPHPT